MQSVTAAPAPASAAAKPRPRVMNHLLNLAAPALELALKTRARAIEPSKEIRPVVEKLLHQLDEGGVQVKYHPKQVAAAKFALVAFIDEAVLTLDRDLPMRQEWKLNPLQSVYFNTNAAGEMFFEHVYELLQNVEANADVIEVYYVCLLLGFKGEYSEESDAERLRATIKDMADRLRGVGRLRKIALSGHWQARDQPEVVRDKGLPLWFKIGGATLLALALFTYIILYTLLLRDDLTIVR